MKQFNEIVILTGAGISAESGLSTFRDNNGLWDNHRIEDVATPEAFARNPQLVQQFYNMRRTQLTSVKPNAAHEALATLAEEFDGRVTLITQNVDNLHARALEKRALPANFQFIQMHGALTQVRCTQTGIVYNWLEDITPHIECACCYESGTLRPHIVWFGEMPLLMEAIYAVLQQCDIFISIGTSGTVYPAAGFVQEVRRQGKAETWELNLEPSLGHSLFENTLYGKASKIVPRFINELLNKTV